MFGEAVKFSVLVVKSGCPSTAVALPTQTGHLELNGSLAVGLGSWLERPPKRRTRLFDGEEPTWFESATNRVSAA